MLNLNIKNFKCFCNADVPINNLTVFAGGNGNGKSTAIQSLLLLRRTIEHCAKWEQGSYNYDTINNLNVELNGVYCLNLGNSSYVITNESEDDTIAFGISDNNDNKFLINYDPTDNELWLKPKLPLVNKFRNNPLYYQEFYYLNAERIGPRITQSIKFYDYPNVGFQGEFTAQIISDLNYTFKVDERKINKEYIKGSRFEHQVNAWLSYILNGVTIIPHKDDKTHSARIEVENVYSKGNPIIATNTGFGISYSLPIIVAGLIAKEDRFLIIENPEAHLHPSAQSRIGYFLGVIANAGVRVIIETHSDHIINGIQIAVANKAIDASNVTINFFSQIEQNAQPDVNAIRMNEKGELSDWPKGFFDQTQVDYSKLIKLRKNV